MYVYPVVDVHGNNVGELSFYEPLIPSNIGDGFNYDVSWGIHREQTAGGESRRLKEVAIFLRPYFPGEMILNEDPKDNNLHQDLRIILNKHSADTHQDIPDNILATYLIECLKALNTATRRRDAFFNINTKESTEL